jgi:hypothetical protein
MIRLAGGPWSITADVNLDTYLEQAKGYEQFLQDSTWDTFLQNAAIVNEQHPFPAIRAHEIAKWCASEQFGKVLAAMDKKANACAKCETQLPEKATFCPKCGAKVS